MHPTGWNRETSPYHQGEQELHDRLGRKDHQTRMGRQIHRPFMPDQHRDFYNQLPFLVAGSVDTAGWPWASVLFGQPGFVASPHDRSLSIGGGRIAGDPFWDNAQLDAPVGFLGIELPTRRRNRINGVVSINKDTLGVDVVQSYGNCPQYIHTRNTVYNRDPNAGITAISESFTAFSSQVTTLIEDADTFFVASHNDQDDKFDTGGVDASHRGGQPGFVKVEGTTLTIPDYIGNFAFNTLGNFLVNPKAGLLFIDFATGDLIQMVGTVDLLWEPDAEVKSFRGAERAWRFHLDHGHILKAAAPMTWDAQEPSPNSILTGNWAQAAQTQQLEADRAIWRPLRVTKIVDESNEIRSFYLEAQDGKVLLPPKPGQFLTVQVTPDGADAPLKRTYTLSSAASDTAYRISVKRDGVVSGHLHDHVSIGDVINTRAPMGAFWLDTDDKHPAVLLAGGVGITPMMAMARAALSSRVTRRHHRNMTVIHAARTTDQRAFAAELNAFQNASMGDLRYISVISNPHADEVAGRDFHVAGRINSDLLRSVSVLGEADVYLCGPPPFMQSLYDMLIDLGVDDARIFAESFGPASLTRVQSTPSDAADAAIVTFAGAGVEQAWASGDGTLLEFAESHGLTPAFGCRSGSCGSCACGVSSGAVSYLSKPSFDVPDGQALLCCSVPAKSDAPLILDL